MNALIFGAPGSGKGTYASRLKTKLGVEVIAMGDIFRAIMKEDTLLAQTVRSFVQAGLLVPDEIALAILKDRLRKIPKGRGFILDGYPRTLAQANELEEIAKIDVVLQLCVPDWVIVERLSGRRVCKNCATVFNLQFLKPKVENVCDKCGGPLYRRPDDNPEVIKIRLDLYERETSPIVRYYEGKKVPFIVHKSDNLEVPPDQVVEEFLAELKQLKLV
jgi:adenylate kinase